MPATDKAVELAQKAATAGGKKAWELAKKGAANKAVKGAGKKAGEGVAIAAAGGAAKEATTAFSRRRTDRRNRRLAFDLAKQTGGSFSERTVIGGQRFYVVWRGDAPVDCFPPLPKDFGSLAERPELQDFQGVRISPTAKAKAK